MSEGFIVSARQSGRPGTIFSDRERECYTLLEQLGIAYEWVEFSRQPETTAEAEEVDRALGVPGLKNLIFQNRNRSRTLFLLLPREKRLDAKALAKSRNITRLSMVNAAALEELLHTHAGAVGAMELMYDLEGKLELFIDREVLEGAFVRFPPNADGRLVRIATADFVEKLLPAIKHGYTVLEGDDPAFTGAEALPEAPFAFRKMRRSRQQLRLSESRAILERGTCGVLALSGDGGYPYALPMSYAYQEGKLYFHAARTGHKMDALARCDKASFCVVDQDEIVLEQFTTYYRSATAFGRIRVAEDPAEILAGLRALGEKYSPGRPAELEAEIQKELAAVTVLVLTVEHLTGKQAVELLPQPEKARAENR